MLTNVRTKNKISKWNFQHLTPCSGKALREGEPTPLLDERGK